MTGQLSYRLFSLVREGILCAALVAQWIASPFAYPSCSQVESRERCYISTGNDIPLSILLPLHDSVSRAHGMGVFVRHLASIICRPSSSFRISVAITSEPIKYISFKFQLQVALGLNQGEI